MIDRVAPRGTPAAGMGIIGAAILTAGAGEEAHARHDSGAIVMSSPGPIVDVAWLRANLGQPGVVVIDARPVDHYLAGSIPGASHIDVNLLRIPYSTPEAVDAFVTAAGDAARKAGLNGDETVVFVEDFSGTLSARGVWLLDAIGHGGGAMLDGGLRAWLEDGGEIERPTARPNLGTFQPELNRSVTAMAEDLLAGGESGEMEIIDTRADQEWQSGTIPASLHVEWVRNLAPDGRFLPIENLRSLYAGIGITPASPPVATFCGSGFRAAHTYVVLKALGIQTTNYVPSWGEWSRRRDLPIAPPSGD